ncbi:reverse transcriptase domain-containing protein [Tanacetum coccineum]|uniref:Reverse transcriptase domain-containing protein n=1 Tax=Tanacetum coccineum TaxID=301880 RepID=A0ABQ5AJN0_9ASTR
MLKDLCANKEKLEELANTPLSENCSAVILKKLPEKLGDSCRFTIPCDFSKLKCQGLADLGASINLMPLSVFHRLGFTNLESTQMTLELANRQLCRPDGICKDVLVPDLFAQTFSGSTTNSLHSLLILPMKTSDNIEKFTDELAPLNSLPPGCRDKFLLSPHITSPKASKLEDYLEKDSIPPGINLTLPSTLEVLSSNPTFPTLTGEKRICPLTAAFSYKETKTLSSPQEIEESRHKLRSFP